MKNETLEFIIDSLQDDRPIVLAIVVSSSGHAPGREGFSMAVTENTLFGTIGGGTIEKNMVITARKFIKEGKIRPEVFHYIHNLESGKNSSGMICGGNQTIVLYPIKKSNFKPLEQCLESYLPDGTPKVFRLSPSSIECLSEERSTTHCFKNSETNDWIYEEVVGQKDVAYIFGGGHVCLALSPVLASLGFRIVVLDERPLINTLHQNKFINELFISPFKELPKMIKEGSHSYAFIMTPSHVHDETILRGLLGKNLKYIGMMASKTKVAEIFTRLEKESFTKERLNAVYSPIGIPIKSRTPEEIAISIAAEVIRVRNAT